MKYNKDEKALIWLANVEYNYVPKKHALLELYNNPSELYDNFNIDNQKIRALLAPADIAKMELAKDDKFIDTFIANCLKQEIIIVTLASDAYPELLKETDKPPLVLYCKGDISLLNTECIAIVGTRRPTTYGKEITYKFGFELAKAGITVVSGLAYGVDTQALNAALDANGKTIAVLGSGVNHIYPASNTELANKIIEKGLLISEYKPNDKPERYTFPERNRIVAGLSKGTLITEAGEKSGTMHTKDYALDYNRNLFVIPGRLTDKLSIGCNNIIKSLQGAMVLEVADILEIYNLKQTKDKFFGIQLDYNDELVLSYIDVSDPVHYEILLRKCKFASRELNTILMRLELKGLIKKEPGNFYYKK